ncbi:MAG: efflux RND transporter periplasmic adaptor subunit [Bacteroidota bacterium]|nr:efflux RND transporter periplasmic adaptor subunit [Bacteroidota bacterium]
MARIIVIACVVVLTGASLWYFNRNGEEEQSPYRFVTIEQGDLEAVVASTGALDAVTTVQVGTQVSGIISEIYVDFNDNVYEGQIIARIDTTLLSSAVRDAEATVERNRAQLKQAERELERISTLYEKQFVTEVDYNQAQYDLDIALAATKSAQISLERARQNLSYATIFAPISGTVIERNVDVGQTVAASFSAPQLFLIADDLSSMEILASVDESDIGMIKEGQLARFTVQAYPDEMFTGMVRQVRLQSIVEENVVNYTVVIDVENPDGRLLPGMTATVDFLIETATDVLKVANAAMRFRATPSMYEALRARMEAARAEGSAGQRSGGESGRGGVRPDASSGSAGNDVRSEGPGGGAQARGGQGAGFAGMAQGGGFGGGAFGGGFMGRDDISMVWFLDDTGSLAMVPAEVGISDGQMTQISHPRLQPGMEIIAGVTQQEENGTGNPFQNQQRGFRPGGF